MSKFQLELQEIPEEARSSIVEAGRTAGPPLNRKQFNTALMGATPLPMIIATSADASAIDKLERKLTRAGAVVAIREPQEATGLSDQIAGLSTTVKSLSQKEKMALGAVTTIAIVAVVMVTSFLFGNESDAPMRVEIPVNNKFTKSSSTATTSIAKSPTRVERKPTPFADFVVDLRSAPNPCESAEKKGNCLLGQLRTLSSTTSNSAPLDDESYLKALHHRFFLCLAEEQSRPKEGDKQSVEIGLRTLSPYLFVQYGAKDCTESRSAMYECVKSARSQTCEALQQQIQLAQVELDNQPTLRPWSNKLSALYRDKVSSCLEEEQRRSKQHSEFVKLELYRQGVAAELEKVKNTCKEEEYIACGTRLSSQACSTLEPYLTLNPEKLVRTITDRCEILKTCR